MNLLDRALKLLPRPIAERIDAFPLGRRLARGAFWTLVGAVASRFFRIPMSIILTRVMGPAPYGELGIATASIDLFRDIAGLGVGITATKYIAELRTKDPARAGRMIAVSTVVATFGGAAFAILFYALAPWLAAHTLAAPQLAVPLRIGTLALFFAVVNGAQLGALFGFEAFRVSAQLQGISGFLDSVLMLGGYFLGGLDGVLWGMTISRFCYWFLMRRAMLAEARRHNVPLIFSHWRQELTVLWHFSIPAALAGAILLPVNWVCSAILVNQPHGYAEMGAYNATAQWFNLLMFMPVVLGGALLPILSDRMGDRDAKSSERILFGMMKLNGAIVIPAAVFMSLFSPLIMRLYGKGYTSAWPTLIAVLWTAAIMGVIAPVNDVIAASGRMWVNLIMNAAWAAVYVSSTLLLAHHGSFGLASSRLIAYGAHAVWTIGFAFVLIRSHRRLQPLPQPQITPVSVNADYAQPVVTDQVSP